MHIDNSSSMGNNIYNTVSLMKPYTKYMDSIVQKMLYKQKNECFFQIFLC